MTPRDLPPADVRRHRKDLVVAKTNATKILITGVFSTGKTTLCRSVQEALTGGGMAASTVHESARGCPFALFGEQTALATMWLVTEQIRKEIEELVRLGEGIVICDRGIPDYLSHLIAVGRDSSDHVANGIITLGQEWCRTYRHIFLSRLDDTQPIQDDGGRLIDRDYQRKLEGSIISALEALGIEATTLPSGLADRTRHVVKQVLG